MMLVHKVAAVTFIRCCVFWGACCLLAGGVSANAMAGQAGVKSRMAPLAKAANATVKAAASASTILRAGAGLANATEPLAGAMWTEPKTGMEFVWVPSGCFQMGSSPQEHGRNFDEGPVHRVCVSGFWMGKTEVTQGQWAKMTKTNPSLIANGEDYPVDSISWDMAQKFIKTLNSGADGQLRLPTEAEWEYACRAGTTTAYAFGDVLSHDQATFEKPYVLSAPSPMFKRKTRRSRRASKPRAPKTWPNMHTNVVASFQPNAFGLYDMHGNVWEWCEDVYNASFYSHSAQQDPINVGKGTSRVLRGGSWVTKVETLRSANRSRGWPDLRTAFYGVRLVRSLRQVPHMTPTPGKSSR